MKFLVVTAVTVATAMGVYLFNDLLKKKEEVAGQPLEKTEAVVQGIEENTKEIPKVDEKPKVNLEASNTVKQAPKAQRKPEKKKVPKGREFKELLEDDIEFIEMT